jgi:hypothetical protein
MQVPEETEAIQEAVAVEGAVHSTASAIQALEEMAETAA